MTEFKVVYITTPGEFVSLAIARALVERRLAACVNIVPGIRSVFHWQGKVQDDAEELLVVKTTSEKVPKIIEAMEELHPYDVPEVIALPIEQGSQPYLNWLADETSDKN